MQFSTGDRYRSSEPPLRGWLPPFNLRIHLRLNGLIGDVSRLVDRFWLAKRSVTSRDATTTMMAMTRHGRTRVQRLNYPDSMSWIRGGYFHSINRSNGVRREDYLTAGGVRSPLSSQGRGNALVGGKGLIRVGVRERYILVQSLPGVSKCIWSI